MQIDLKSHLQELVAAEHNTTTKKTSPSSKTALSTSMPLPTFLPPPTFLPKLPPTPFHTPTSTLSKDPYKTLQIPSNTPLPKIRAAYLHHARTLHPDTRQTENPRTTTTRRDTKKQWEQVCEAWRVLSDETLRGVYDRGGISGLRAYERVEERGIVEEVEGFGEEGGFGLIESSGGGGGGGVVFEEGVDVDGNGDCCPRSVEEGVWNLRWNKDIGVRYYAMWWVYRFGVKEAVGNLVEVVGGEWEVARLRRRAMLALGKVVGDDGDGRVGREVVEGLVKGLRSRDYGLRYRTCEAVARIAGRLKGVDFGEEVVEMLLGLLEVGGKRLKMKEEGRTGFLKQESLFDLDKFDGAVRERLESVFRERRVNEEKSRRTTMTPNLDVDPRVESDEPFEWILKAVGAIGSVLGEDGGSRRGIKMLTRKRSEQEVLSLVETFTRYPIPLVKYAAQKAMYCLTSDEKYASVLIQALGYGIEHHYSQRVLIRDLGDVGYAQGAKAVAQCPMVENSFKILALRNMLKMHKHDPLNGNVRMVLKHMDSLL